MIKHIPNLLTIVRIILIPFYIAPFIYNNLYGKNSLFIGFILFVILSITDFLDGYLARKYRVISNLGKVLDPLADKLLVYSAFFLLVYLQRFPIWIIFFLLIREIFVTIHRNAAMREDIAIAAVKSGKIKTTVQLTTIIVGFINYIGNEILFSADKYLIYLTLVITIYSGIDYLLKNGAKIKSKHFYDEIQRSFLNMFGAGKIPKTPGTAASFITAVLFFLFYNFLISIGLINVLWYLIILIISIIYANKSMELFGENDSKQIVIDEFLGQIIPLFFFSKNIYVFILAFVIFRIFDILKPFPVSYFDKIKNGIGIVIDDVVAGILTLAVLKLIFYIA